MVLIEGSYGNTVQKTPTMARDCSTQRNAISHLKFFDWYNIEVGQRPSPNIPPLNQWVSLGSRGSRDRRSDEKLLNPCARRSRTSLRLSPSPLRYETMILLRRKRPTEHEKYNLLTPSLMEPPTGSKFVARTHRILDRSLASGAEEPSGSATCPPFSNRNEVAKNKRGVECQVEFDRSQWQSVADHAQASCHF
jgi:hypothetical protein